MACYTNRPAAQTNIVVRTAVLVAVKKNYAYLRTSDGVLAANSTVYVRKKDNIKIIFIITGRKKFSKQLL